MEPNAHLSILPFAYSAEDIIFFFYLFARVSGLFLISPLLSTRQVPVSVRTFLSLFITLLLGMALYSDYRGPEPRLVVAELIPGTELSILMLALTLVKEVAIGFMIGWAFTIFYEATLLAGQLIGVMMGFSITEILDPVSNTSKGVISQLFSLTATLLIIVFDLHHVFIRVLADSFSTLPLGHYQLPYELLHDITHGTARLFQHGMQMAAIPFAILALVTIGLGFMARVMPEMNIFMVGFPLKILIGYYGLIFTITYFPLILRQAFEEYLNLARLIIHHISLSA